MRIARSASHLVLLVVLQTPGLSQIQRAKLIASDTGAGDEFGLAVSISGDTAFVGAPYDDDAAEQSGSVYVFERTGATWTETQKLRASDAAYGDAFGAAVAVSGDLAVVGAPNRAGGIPGAGAGYVFEKLGGTWTERATLVAGDAAPGAHLGSVACIAPDRLVLSAWQDPERGLDAGAVYVFERIAGSWAQAAKLAGRRTDAFDACGRSVALAGDRVLVGAPCEDGAGAQCGAAYLFERGPSGWDEVQRLAADDAASYDYLWWSVALDGATALVGAIGDDAAGSSSGATYVFERRAAGWAQVQKLVASDAAAGDAFGDAIAVSGDEAIVGALDADALGEQSGSAYRFRRAGSAWAQAGKLLALDGHANCLFGAAVSISGSRALVGANVDDAACPTLPACRSGSAYVLELAPDAAAPPDEPGLRASSLPPNPLGLYFTSTVPSSVPAFDALRRVGGGESSLVRFAPQDSGAIGRIVQGPGIVAWSQSHLPAAARIAGRQTWNLQVWYRDPDGPCGATTNYTNAVQVAFHP